MADISKTVEIIFGGKNDISATVDQVSRDFDKLGGNITNIAGPLAGITDKVLLAETAFATLAIAGMGYAIKSAGEFEASFDRVSLRINASTTDIEKFKGDVLAYGIDSSRSLSDINAALAESIQRGVSYTDALSGLSTAEKLAVATHSDLKSSTVLLSTVMNSYGASMSEATHYGDLFTQGVKIGAGEIPQLSEEMGKVAGIAHAMGIPLETLVAAMGALGSYGIDTSSALGGLKFMLNNLLDPSKEATKEANNLGISFGAAAVKSLGLETVLKNAYIATNGNAEAMKVLFGSVRGLNVAVDLAADSQGKFKDALIATRNSTGVMQAEYDKFVNDFENVNARLKNSFEVNVITIGQKLMPEYAKIASALSDLFKGLKVGIDAGTFDPLFKALDEWGSKVAETIRLMAKNLPEAMKGLDFTELIKSLESLGGSFAKAFGDIFGNVDLTTAEGLHTVLQRIIDAFAKLTEFTKGVVDGMEPLFKLIGAGISQFEGMDSAGFNLMGTIGGVAESVTILADNSKALTAVLSILTTKALFDTATGVVKVGASALGIIPAFTTLIASMGLVEFGMVGMAAAFGVAIGTLLNQSETVGTASQSLLGLIDVNKDFFGAQGRTKEQMDDVNKAFDAAVAKHKMLSTGTDETTDATKKYNETMKALDLSSAQKAFDDLNASLKKSRDEMEQSEQAKKWNVDITVLADGTSIEKANNLITQYFPDGRILITNVGAEADEAGLKKVQKKIDDAIPKDKQVEIQAKLDEAKIKGQADIIQHAVEWKAKLDIANVEANAKIVEAAFKSIDNTISSTGTTLTSMLGTYAELMGSGKGGTSFIEQQVVNENRRRDEALAEQKLLLDAEIANIRARTDAMNRGDSIIKIDGTGLAPHLEAFMFAVLAAIQVRVNQDYGDFLVGVK